MTKTVTTGKATDLITFTRSSTGTYLDSVKYGDELVTNGTFDSGTTGWSTNSTTEALQVVNGKLRVTEDGVADPNVARAWQTITTEIGKTYRVTGDIDPVNTSSCALNISNSVSTSQSINVQTSSTATTAVFYFTAINTTTYVLLTANSATTVGSYADFDNISVKEIIGNQGTSGEPLLRTADTNEPRIEYDADGNLKGLLIEEQRTNNVTQSEDLTTWSKASGGAVVANQAIAPDGTKTADEMVGVVYKTPNAGSGTRAFSVFLKAKAGTTAQVRIDVPASNRITVDLTDGSVIFSTGSSLDSYGVVDVGNGWYRCHIVVTDSINNYVIVGEANNASHTLYAWGAQLEAGSFPTSYIPTSGSTVTRNADVASINLSEFEYNHTESTILVEGEKTARNTGSTGVFTFVALHDGGTSNRVLLYYNNTILRGQLKTADSVVAQFSSEVAEGGKLGLAYKENDVAFTSNGGTVNTDTNAAIPAGLNTLAIGGYSYSTGQELNGHIKSVKYYPVRLTDNQLKALTQ